LRMNSTPTRSQGEVTTVMRHSHRGTRNPV